MFNILKFNPWKSMTVQGTVGALVPYVVNTFDPSAISPKAGAVITGLGILWSVVGLRNAVPKTVQQVLDPLLNKAGGR